MLLFPILFGKSDFFLEFRVTQGCGEGLHDPTYTAFSCGCDSRTDRIAVMIGSSIWKLLNLFPTLVLFLCHIHGTVVIDQGYIWLLGGFMNIGFFSPFSIPKSDKSRINSHL